MAISNTQVCRNKEKKKKILYGFFGFSFGSKKKKYFVSRKEAGEVFTGKFLILEFGVGSRPQS